MGVQMFGQNSVYMCVRHKFDVRMFDVLHYCSVLLCLYLFHFLKLYHKSFPPFHSLLQTFPHTPPYSSTNSWPLFFITVVTLIYIELYTYKFLHTYIQPAQSAATPNTHRDLLYFYL